MSNLAPGTHITRGGHEVRVEENRARIGDGLPWLVSYRSRCWTCGDDGRVFPGGPENEFDVI